jgi:hypothetical protein
MALEMGSVRHKSSLPQEIGAEGPRKKCQKVPKSAIFQGADNAADPRRRRHAWADTRLLREAVNKRHDGPRETSASHRLGPRPKDASLGLFVAGSLFGRTEHDPGRPDKPNSRINHSGASRRS